MRERALVHVTGPAGAGKTTFIERLLHAEVAFAICVRAQREVKHRNVRESAPKSHAELRRYRGAGAGAVSLYRFAEPNPDAFFTSDFMREYSEAVFIEGDCPIDYVDLSVFVAPTPPKGRSLLRRVIRDQAAAHRESIDQFAQALENPDALARLLGAGLGEPFVALAFEQPRVLDQLRRSLKAKLGELRRAPPPAPTEHWALEEGFVGIERAQLVIVNARSDTDHRSAELAVAEVTRLRKDAEVYRDVVGLRRNKLPVTAVVANLVNPKDPGLKKAVARVKRATKRR